MKLGKIFVLMSVLVLSSAVPSQAQSSDSDSFVRVSPGDSRYFELSNGRPFIPVGLNMIAPWGKNADESLARMADWIDKLSANGGNYIRLWLGHDFFDVEHERCGEYDGDKAKRIDAVLAMARRRGIRVKMTIEHFRHFFGEYQKWAAKPLHHVSLGGTAKDLDDFFGGRASKEQFKKKLDWYKQRYGDEPAIFAWELWNEIDAVSGKGYEDWTVEMLGELQKRFARNMATQSLGSFDRDGARGCYRRFSLMADNDFANVHRYLDLGASLEICRGPVDILAADAVKEILRFKPGKPVLLAESGAVEPRHSGPFKLYKDDKAGVILHDVLFAPFFAGAAGSGQIWHWDQYVAANDLWFQFGRFAEAVKGIDPAAEGFEPVELHNGQVRVYALRGRKTFLAWCRDIKNNWESELGRGEAAGIVKGASVELRDLNIDSGRAEVSFYDPWADNWHTGRPTEGKVALPEFSRSIVVRITY
ncbi:MAG: cellulase family glycosylhydrolase [Sedimentisphaerales bacterium]|nr:cellulase family glycosylhydrolase [Sedimentisphaerales bacterium]